MSLKPFCVLVLLGLSSADFICKNIDESSQTDYVKPHCYVEKCVQKIQTQVEEELKASLAYLYTGAHFDHEDINRPGLAKFMYAAASEERQHAILMLDYLNHRGIPHTSNFAASEPLVSPDISYREALTFALNLEITVTQLIHKIIEECVDDFHAADKFTEPVMAEQHESIRHLQAMIKEYDNMVVGTKDFHELAFAEYLFDRKLLNEEL